MSSFKRTADGDTIHVYKNGVELDDFILIYQGLGGTKCTASGPLITVHAALALRELADAMEADPKGCNCGEH